MKNHSFLFLKQPIGLIFLLAGLLFPSSGVLGSSLDVGTSFRVAPSNGIMISLFTYKFFDEFETKKNECYNYTKEFYNLDAWVTEKSLLAYPSPQEKDLLQKIVNFGGTVMTVFVGSTPRESSQNQSNALYRKYMIHSHILVPEVFHETAHHLGFTLIHGTRGTFSTLLKFIPKHNAHYVKDIWYVGEVKESIQQTAQRLGYPKFQKIQFPKKSASPSSTPLEQAIKPKNAQQKEASLKQSKKKQTYNANLDTHKKSPTTALTKKSQPTKRHTYAPKKSVVPPSSLLEQVTKFKNAQQNELILKLLQNKRKLNNNLDPKKKSENITLPKRSQLPKSDTYAPKEKGTKKKSEKDLLAERLFNSLKAQKEHIKASKANALAPAKGKPLQTPQASEEEERKEKPNRKPIPSLDEMIASHQERLKKFSKSMTPKEANEFNEKVSIAIPHPGILHEILTENKQIMYNKECQKIWAAYSPKKKLEFLIKYHPWNNMGSEPMIIKELNFSFNVPFSYAMRSHQILKARRKQAGLEKPCRKPPRYKKEEGGNE